MVVQFFAFRIGRAEGRGPLRARFYCVSEKAAKFVDEFILMVEHAAVTAGYDRLMITASVGAVLVEYETRLAQHRLRRTNVLAGVAGHESGLAEERKVAGAGV